MLAALSTGNKIGLLVVAGVLIVFALLSSFVFPRYWPQFPGSRGLRAYIVGCLVLFVAMVLAVEFFAIEEEEAEAGAEPAAVADEAPEQTGGASGEGQTVTVSGSEFAFALSRTALNAGPTVFELENDGEIGHDLAIEGPGVEDAKTPVIQAGQTAEIEVELESGTYDLYCTVPGHLDAGMEAEVTVS